MSEQVSNTHWMFEIWVRVIRALDRSSMDVRTAVRSQHPTFKFMSNEKLSFPDSNNFVFFFKYSNDGMRTFAYIFFISFTLQVTIKLYRI